jgi:hypothetical protein
VGRLRLTEPITSDASRSGFRRFQSATRSKSNLGWGSRSAVRSNTSAQHGQIFANYRKLSHGLIGRS